MSDILPMIAAIRNLLVRTLKPQRLLLFGSYARQVFTERSDVDITVITQVPVAPPQRIALRSLLSDFPVEVDLIFYTQAELEAEAARPNTFAYRMLLSSQLLYPIEPCTKTIDIPNSAKR